MNDLIDSVITSFEFDQAAELQFSATGEKLYVEQAQDRLRMMFRNLAASFRQKSYGRYNDAEKFFEVTLIAEPERLFLSIAHDLPIREAYVPRVTPIDIDLEDPTETYNDAIEQIVKSIDFDRWAHVVGGDLVTVPHVSLLVETEPAARSAEQYRQQADLLLRLAIRGLEEPGGDSQIIRSSPLLRIDGVRRSNDLALQLALHTMSYHQELGDPMKGGGVGGRLDEDHA